MTTVPDPNTFPTMDLWPDVAHAFGISRSSVYAAAASGEIPTIRLGRRLLAPTAAIRKMLRLDVVEQPETEPKP